MRKFFTVFLLFAIQSASFAQHPVLEDYWWQPDGPVNVVEFDTLSQQLYLGGLFNSVAANVKFNAFLDKENGYPDTRYPKFLGQSPPYNPNFTSSVADGSGGWYVGGYFNKVGDSTRNRIAHILSTGEVSGKFKDFGLNGVVNDLAFINDTLFISGQFSAFGNIIRNVSSINFSSGLVTSDFPETNGSNIYEIISDGMNGWFMSGNFTMVGDSLRSGIAHVNNMFQVTGWNPKVNGAINSMCIYNGHLYVGGYFDTINGTSRNNLAAIQIASGSLNSFAPSVSGGISKIDIQNNKVCFIGDFSSVNGGSTGNFAMVDATTGATIPETISFGTTFWGNQGDLMIKGDTLYIGGNFSYGVHNFIIGVELINNTVLSWNPNLDSTVTNINWYNDSLVVGGDFYQTANVIKIDPVTGFKKNLASTSGGVLKLFVAGDTLLTCSYQLPGINSVCAFNLTNNSLINFEPSISGYVNSIAINGSSIVAGGINVEAVEGEKRFGLAAYDVNSETLISWNPPDNNGGVGTIFVDGDKVYVGGDFGLFGDSLRSKVVQLNRTDGSVTAWKGPNLSGWGSGWVNEMYVDSSSIFAGGNFSYQGLNGTEQNLAVINKTTGALQPWNFSTNVVYGIVTSLLPYNDKLIIAGGFDSIGGQNIAHIVAVDPDNGTIFPLNINVNKPIQDLSIDEDILYMVGVFDSINGVSRRGVGAFDFNSNTVSAWNPDPDFSSANMAHINSVNNRVLVGGNFERIGRIQRKNFVALNAFTGQPTDLNPEPNKEVTCIAYTQDALYLGGYYDTISNTPRTKLSMIDKNTGSLNSWNPGLVASVGVNDIQVESGKLFVGGVFGIIAGQPRMSIAAFDLPAHTLNPFYYNIHQHVYDFDIRSDTLFLGGFLDTIPGSNVGVIGVNYNTSIQTNLNDSAGVNSSVQSVSVAGDKLVVGGNFTLMSGQARNRLAAFDIASGNLSSWNPSQYSSYTAINATAVHDSLVYVGGGNSVASISLNSGLRTDWNPYFSGTINELKVSGPRLFIGGYFYQNSNFYTRNNLVVLKLKSGLKIYPVSDQFVCGADTLNSIIVKIEDSFDVNTVLLEAFSSDTNLVQPYNISFSGIGANRIVTVILNPGFAGVCTIGIKATSQSGEIDYTYFNITNNVIQFSLPVGISICQGNTGILDAGPGFSGYLWNTGDLTQVISISQAGFYSVTVTNDHGCTSSDTMLVSVIPNPSVFITASTSTDICQGDSVLLSASPGYSFYQWMKNGIALTGVTSPDFFAKLTGTYSCVITDSNGCSGLSNNIKVKIVCVPIGPNQERSYQLDFEETLTATIHPNPSMEDFQLIVNCNINSSTVISVYDSHHRVVQTGNFDFNDDFYTIRKMSPGVYFVEIRCGNQIIIKKLVQMD